MDQPEMTSLLPLTNLYLGGGILFVMDGMRILTSGCMSNPKPLPK
jgi:hypothetical protein